ncbi:RNA polymerase sigma-70 factor (ECF subfamily) [Aureimonas jatrophae]|nr:RNA polymerase sigma-70 factor (ECF subfamily) [Aureimonas jatrophae]
MQQVYLLTAPKLRRVADDLLRNHDEADELVHEAFLAVWAKAHRFDPARGSPVTWLVTIVRNRALDRLRARRRTGIQVPLEEGQEIADERPDALAQVAADNDAQRLRSCLTTLDIRTQRFITRTFFEGLRYEDLAREEAVPLGTVKTVIRRGLIKLRLEWDRGTVD